MNQADRVAKLERVIRFLMEEFKQSAIQAKAQGTALRVLCLGLDWRGRVDIFAQQVEPEISQAFDRIFASLLAEDNDIPIQDQDWELTVKKLLDSVPGQDRSE